MRSIRIMMLVALLSSPLWGWAQSDNPPSLRVNDYLRSGSSLGLGLQTLGIFNPSRMTFQHSYSMSYLSSGGQSAMQGLFMETIGYRLSNPLSLTLNLGYMHQPYSSFGPDGLTQNSAFVGGAALDWRPTNNMFFRFEVGRYPAYYQSRSYPYWEPSPYIPRALQPQETLLNTPIGEE